MNEVQEQSLTSALKPLNAIFTVYKTHLPHIRQIYYMLLFVVSSGQFIEFIPAQLFLFYKRNYVHLRCIWFLFTFIVVFLVSFFLILFCFILFPMEFTEGKYSNIKKSIENMKNWQLIYAQNKDIGDTDSFLLGNVAFAWTGTA